MIRLGGDTLDGSIIIVEDKKDLRELYVLAAAMVLPKADVIPVSRAEAVLDIAKELSDALIITDNDTNSLMSGIEAMRALNDYKKAKGLPIPYSVLVTGLSNGSDLGSTRDAANRAGIHEVHVKPIDPFSEFPMIYQRYQEYKSLAVATRSSG